MTTSNPKYLPAALALAAGASKTEAARKAKVSRTTINNWIKKQDFQEFLDKLKREHFLKSVDKSISTIDPALDFLRQVMKDKDEKTADRLRAANKLLSFGSRNAEAKEILDRIEKLEKKIDANDQAIIDIFNR